LCKIGLYILIMCEGKSRLSVFNRQSYFKRRERQNKTLLFWHFLPLAGIFLTSVRVKLAAKGVPPPVCP
ncbi:MAG: hypothetical protein MR299_04340, partial [Bacteroidales bacterium]|nr:hypothetical protein [Bacteroidales bacterium]